MLDDTGWHTHLSITGQAGQMRQDIAPASQSRMSGTRRMAHGTRSRTTLNRQGFPLVPFWIAALAPEITPRAASGGG
jgi:hypothetical protein